MTSSMKTLSDYLQTHARGEQDERAGQALTELIASVMNHEAPSAKGDLTIKIGVSRAGDAQVKVEVTMTQKQPKGKATTETLWADESGQVSREAPRPDPTPLESYAARKGQNRGEA